MLFKRQKFLPTQESPSKSAITITVIKLLFCFMENTGWLPVPKPPEVYSAQQTKIIFHF